MLMKYELNPQLPEYEVLLQDIKTIFSVSGELIYKKRNEIKNIVYDDVSWNVKSFATPNIINKIIYSFFRLGKAQRSYQYSQKIAEFVPEPLGYVEYYHFGFLNESYFISKEFNYDLTIREILFDYDALEKRNILKSFAKFTFLLHEAGINHLDYSPGNILIKKEKEGYVFKIVDINRMRFEKMDMQKRAKNFSKIWLKDEDLEAIIKEYVCFAPYDYEEMVKLALMYSRKHKEKANFKKHLKNRWRK